MIQLVVLLFFAKLTQFEIGKSGKNFDVSFIGLWMNYGFEETRTSTDLQEKWNMIMEKV